MLQLLIITKNNSNIKILNMNNNFLNVYNNLIKLTRNINLYKNFKENDEFSDRLIFLLIHFAFFFKAYKQTENSELLQRIYDYIFKQIELSIREIGYGDQSINKKMKDYVNLFYAIIDKVHFWDKMNFEQKLNLLNIYLEKSKSNAFLVDYFDDYLKSLSKNNLNSYLKSVFIKT